MGLDKSWMVVMSGLASQSRRADQKKVPMRP